MAEWNDSRRGQPPLSISVNMSLKQLADRSLNLDVVAEGVETKDQRDQLIALGCPLAQGFYFSKPVDTDATEEALHLNRTRTAQISNPEEELVGALPQTGGDSSGADGSK